MELELSGDLIDSLTDEAYSTLCRQSLNAALEQIESEKEVVLTTRPPFGMLATKQARETYETTLKSVLDNEVGIRRRLKQLDLIDPKLKVDIEEGLHQHLLSTANHEYKSCSQACEITDAWSQGITALHEQGVALARDTRALVGVIESTPSTAPIGSKKPGPTLHALANLRATVETLQADVAKIQEVSERFLRLISNESADAVQLPELPPFRTVKWVEGLTQMENAEALGEVRRCETEARAFTTTGMKSLLAQAEDVHAACQEVRKDILNQSAVKFRAYALSHFVAEREVDEVLAELIEHRASADLKRVAGLKSSRNPFAAER